MTLELAIERRIPAPVDTVWRAWTEHLPKWWAPRPWTTELLALDLAPAAASPPPCAARMARR